MVLQCHVLSQTTPLIEAICCQILTSMYVLLENQIDSTCQFGVPE